MGEDFHEELNKEFGLFFLEIEVNDHRIGDNAEVKAAKMFQGSASLEIWYRRFVDFPKDVEVLDSQIERELFKRIWKGEISEET